MSEELTVEELVKAMRLCAEKTKNGETCVTGQKDCPFGVTVMDYTERMNLATADALESLAAERDAYRDKLKAALAENTRLAQQVPHWISVKDRLPEVDEDLPDYAEDIFIPIIICDEDGDVYPVKFGKESKEFKYEDGGRLMSTVLYWMPLPEAPKEENNA
ncbi:MAG: DUF551 domain-containing protein [Ruminococcaceae bacterium]|nr:DUF551 domain-containing protein [Oscillospiraceae bacterium]